MCGLFLTPIVPPLFQVVKQCCGTDGVEANYIKTEILPPFFKHFWQHRMALDRRNYRQVGTHNSHTHMTPYTNDMLNLFGQVGSYVSSINRKAEMKVCAKACSRR